MNLKISDCLNLSMLFGLLPVVLGEGIRIHGKKPCSAALYTQAREHLSIRCTSLGVSKLSMSYYQPGLRIPFFSR